MPATMKLRIQGYRRLESLFPPPSTRCSKRFVHSSRVKQASALPATPSQVLQHPQPTKRDTEPCLSILPLSSVLRTYLVTSMSSSPILLSACFTVLNRMLASKSAIMDVDKNFMLAWLLKNTFYAQFCAGENRAEVTKAIKEVKALGYNNVILEYALEVLGGETAAADSAKTKEEIEEWRLGMLETVRMIEPGDFVGLKWSGLGTYALELLKQNKPPTPEMQAAIYEVCDLAASRNIPLLPGAEEVVTNAGLESWTLDLQRKYNTNPNKAIIYTTFQCYLRSTPANLARHVAIAQKEGFTLGAKLVRGAYMTSEPRSAIWSSREGTHEAYDSLATAMLKKEYTGMLQPLPDSNPAQFPDVNLVLATHNQASVENAMAVRLEQARKGEEQIPVAFAQLMGMADEVSCELVKDSKTPIERLERPRTTKCVTWGTTRQCLNYLLRRAAENQDAAGRTAETRRAMGKEVWRRMRGAFGLA